MTLNSADMAAIRAIRAWLRLDGAFGGFNCYLRRRHRVTGIQLAMLRIVDEMTPVTLARMRGRLALHPATLGQLVQRLEALRLVERSVDSSDRRQRRVQLTERGRQLLAAAPLAGPVRLRYQAADEARLRALAAAFEDAVELFGLEAWAA